MEKSCKPSSVPLATEAAAKKLYSDFYAVRGTAKKIGVTLPGFRARSIDFVWDGDRLSNEDVQMVKKKVTLHGPIEVETFSSFRFEN